MNYNNYLGFFYIVIVFARLPSSFYVTIATILPLIYGCRALFSVLSSFPLRLVDFVWLRFSSFMLQPDRESKAPNPLLSASYSLMIRIVYDVGGTYPACSPYGSGRWTDCCRVSCDGWRYWDVKSEAFAPAGRVTWIIFRLQKHKVVRADWCCLFCPVD